MRQVGVSRKDDEPRPVHKVGDCLITRLGVTRESIKVCGWKIWFFNHSTSFFEKTNSRETGIVTTHSGVGGQFLLN